MSALARRVLALSHVARRDASERHVEDERDVCRSSCRRRSRDTGSGRQAFRQRPGAARCKWFAGALFLVVCWFWVFTVFTQKTQRAPRAGEQTDRMAVPYVAVIHATPLNGDSELVLPGNINSYVESPIYARTNGYLKKWYKDIGSHVAKGDLLAEIDTPEVDQQLAQARADLATAQANVKLAGITAQRYQDLARRATPSPSRKWTTTTATTPPSRPWCSPPQANVKRLEDLESFKRVYAPFSGVITQRNVDIGTLINAGNGGNSTKEMFDLAQTDPLRVYVSVPQTYAPSMHEGMKACLELTEFPGRNFCGKVVRTADAIDPGTRTLLTEVDVPNPAGRPAARRVRASALRRQAFRRASRPADQRPALPPRRHHGRSGRSEQPHRLEEAHHRPRSRQQRRSAGGHHRKRCFRDQSAGRARARRAGQNLWAEQPVPQTLSSEGGSGAKRDVDSSILT